jgi:hypothetical protein
MKRIISKIISDQRGIAPLIVIIAIVAILAAGGVTYFVVNKNNISSKDILTIGKSEEPSQETTVDNLQVTSPDFDFTTSPLPKLNTSSVNVGDLALPSSNLVANAKIDTDFSVDADTDFAVPTLDIQVPTIQQEPANTNTTTGGGTNGSTGGTSSPTVNASNCAQFAAVPSCSYVGDSNGQTLCNQCKAAGY